VHEGIGHYASFHHNRLIACHQKALRHSMAMDPAHDAGLLRTGGKSALAAPPRCDPCFAGFGEVMVRGLKLYAVARASEAGDAQ
jgi:hypothetical protein